MSGIKPTPKAHLDERDVDPNLGEPAEDDGRQQLELCRRAMSNRYSIGDRKDLADEASKGIRVDRPAVDL
jgi:hypothetical protein